MGSPKLYTVIESNLFKRQVTDLYGSLRRWDEIKEFFDQYIARNPHIGEQIPGTRIYAVTAYQSGSCLTIYYSIDDQKQEIHLLEIHRLKIR